MLADIAALDIATKVVALCAFVLGVSNLWFANFRRLRWRVFPENQIQMMQADKLIGCNLHFVIATSGPTSKWDVVKFESAILKAADGREYKLSARVHVEDVGNGQRNASRNIPIALKGGEAKSVTLGYQSHEFTTWTEGRYEFQPVLKNSAGKEIAMETVAFTLTANDMKILMSPNAIYMKEL